MTMKTRRLLAATMTSALIAGPVLVCSGPAHAGSVAPASLLGSVTGTTGLLTGGTTTTGTTLPDPLATIVNAVVEATAPVTGGTTTTDPTTVLTNLATGLTTALTTGDPNQVLTGLTSQLTGLGFDSSDVSSLLGTLSTDDLQQIGDALLLALPLENLFGGPIPQPIQDLLLGQPSNPQPDNTDELIAAMTEYYKNQNMTQNQVKDDAAAKALPASALRALLLALAKPTTKPKPPATGPSAACVKATKNVKKLQKQVRIAKLKHQKAKAKRLAKKLTKARITKVRAC